MTRTFPALTHRTMDLAAFLSDIPVLHLQGSGLIVVTAVERTASATQADAERIYNAVHMPGIHRVVIAHGTDGGPTLHRRLARRW